MQTNRNERTESSTKKGINIPDSFKGIVQLKDYKKTFVMLAVFLVYMVLVKTVDVQAIGPNGSEIGFASLNGAVFAILGSHEFFYSLSQVIGFLAFALCGAFGFLGLIQWIKRKRLAKVDQQIIILGLYYLVVIALYFFFTFVAVNYRPILEADGTLESSFPSSHTMLAACVFSAAAYYTRFLPQRFMYLRGLLIKICYGLIGAILVFRILAGVHWLTDIIGGIILSLALINALVTTINKAVPNA